MALPTSDDLRLSSEARPAFSGGVVAALSVYLEPLAADARVAVLGDAELGLFEAILELGARTVHLYDPDPERVSRLVDDVPRAVSVRMLRDDFDVRDGAFDLVVIPDVGLLPDAAQTIVRLRRVVDPRGAVIAMGRARTADSDPGIFPELAAASIDYAELYDLFALQFENVTMTGVLPFTGVVFAELGAGDDLTVSVDTRLVDPEPPGVFVVTASRDEEAILDPYAIVQIARPETELAPTELVRAIISPLTREVEDDRLVETAAAFAAAHLKSEMLAQQLDDQRSRLSATETRAFELEGILNVAQQALGGLEARLLLAEQGLLERDDRIATLTAEMEAEASRAENAAARTPLIDPEAMSTLVRRAEDAEADLAHLMTAHSAETSAAEDQLRERAGVVSTLQKEVDRREALVRELLASLEESREGAVVHVFETAPEPIGMAPEEAARLRRKLDELALEVARRDGELAAQGWSVTELANEKRALEAELLRLKSQALESAHRVDRNLERDLSAARDEIDALRQALTQEHAARVAAESGEELSRARAELARQAVLLQQAERS